MAVFENKYCKSILNYSIKLVICTSIIEGKWKRSPNASQISVITVAALYQATIGVKASSC